MWELYERYWLRFGEILTDMEAEGMKVDVAYLAAQQERAEGEREAALRTFREWVEAQCPGGRYMNASSVKQIQTLLFGGYVNADRAAKYEPELRALRSEVEKARHARSLADATRDGEEVVEACEAALAAAETALVKKESAARQKTEIEREREFPTSKATQNAEEDAPKKVMLRRISEGVLTPEVLTASGLPSVATPVLRQLAGTPEAPGPLHAGFGGGARGDAACAAFRALVEVSAIETLLSNFIEPLQGKFRVLDADQRVHGSFNINTMGPGLPAFGPGAGFSIGTGLPLLDNTVMATPASLSMLANLGPATITSTKAAVVVTGVAGTLLNSSALVQAAAPFVHVIAPGLPGGVVTDGCLDSLTGRPLLLSGTVGAPGFRLN